ncbi:Exportin-7 [Heterocephalus glaber]|uniref:Exportin-7 n=1 Tax=Heterocephalus glaber TaxID=10181 RepID=G5BIQ1_HETGA|nr:Exportin-7 [Heterocephalus glaber]
MCTLPVSSVPSSVFLCPLLSTLFLGSAKIQPPSVLTGRSVYYLLSLCQWLSASVPSVKATEPHMLETHTPHVTKAYITSRLESVHIILRDGLEDPPGEHRGVRKLVMLSVVQFVLNGHISESFSVVGVNNQNHLTDMWCRTTFYTALGHLLKVDLGEDEDQYEQFMLPLTLAFEAVVQMFSTNTFNEQEAAK